MKEWKQVLQNKKMLMMLFGSTLYAPLINQLINYDMGPLMTPIIPLEFGQILILLIGASYSIEFIYSSMNDEFMNQSYEILGVSKINKITIVLCKITLPIFLSSGVLLASFLLNESLITFTNKWSFRNVMSFEFFIFSIFIFIFLALFSTYQLVKQQKVMDKQESTFFIAMGCTFVFLFISLYYLNLIGLVFLSVFIGNAFLFLRIVSLLNQYRIPISEEEAKIHFENQSFFFLILCREGYCRVWSYIKTLIYFIVVILASISLNDYKQPILYDLFPLLAYLFLGNFIISQNLILEKRMNGLLMMKIAKIPYWKIVISRLIMPVSLGVIGTAIIQFVSDTNLLTLGQTLDFLALNFFTSLSILVSYLFIENLKYVTQYRLFITLFILVIGVALVIFNAPWYLTFVIDGLLFLMSIYRLKNGV